jgi:eukaryotic-like serine/threonine-protein kinase
VRFSPELLAAPKSDRYRIDGLLGRGATSLVYKAFDVEKNFQVALKSVRFPDQDGIFRLKQEFRSFRDLYHPNIVELYDLHVEKDSCFYTMELIDGSDFVTFVRSNDIFLRTCVGQLIDSLAAVHQSGRLHRDLKPSNILVEDTGRTVLLDFGLAGTSSPSADVHTRYHLFGGTPGFMAPERLRGEPASSASDLYAVGVILYQALTGVRPYSEAEPLLHYEAQKRPPPSPQSLEQGAPRDLSELALRLLSFLAGDRPSLAEAKRLAESSQTVTASAGRGFSGGLPRTFIGRRAELARLDSAFARTLSGRRVTVLISGVSGVGKTTLIEQFLVETHKEHDALTLRSRCHHQESVSYNAVDGLIDMLSNQLMLESVESLRRIVPEDLPALLTMFPVLGRVAWPPMDFDPDRLSIDPQAVGRQSLSALRQLLRRIATDRPLILWIDDLQWSDAGSPPLLQEIAAAGGDNAPILTIFSYRDDDLRSGAVAVAFELGASALSGIDVERIAVEPLDPTLVGTLVRSLVDSDAPVGATWSDEIVQLSGGLPFFVLQLVGARDSLASSGMGQSLNATGVLDSRLRALPSSQHAILEIVSAASRPLVEETLLRILVGQSASGREIYRLLNQNLLRKVDASGKAAVDTYHDRIRESVLRSLEAGVLQLRHRQIAQEMARAKEIDHPVLVEHYLGSGDHWPASEHAILAARAASGRLAFHQAAEFLLIASRLRDPLQNDAVLLVEFAQALANAGRSSEAADLFLRVAKLQASDAAATTLAETQAAQLLLYSGRLSEGRALCRKIFIDLGIAFPETVRDAQRTSILNRVLFLVGLKRLRVRPGWEGRGEALARVDALWAAAKGFLMLDYVVGDAMFTYYVREAAALGERSRVLRAMSMEGAVMANIGRPWSVRRAASLVQRAELLAEESPDPYDRVVVRTCQACIVWQQGHWAEAERLSLDAIELHRRECGRYEFEVSIARSLYLSSLAFQGFIRQSRAGNREAIEDAKGRGDIYISRYFGSSYSIYAALAEDNPHDIIAESRTVLDDLPTDRFTSLHWVHYLAMPNALVYAGEPWEAWALVQERWPFIREAGFLKLGLVSAHTREIRARTALAAAAAGSPPRACAEWTRNRLLHAAEEDAAAIERMKVLVFAEPLAAAIRAGIGAFGRDGVRRRRMLELAAQGFDRCGMRLHKYAAELQLADPAAREALPAWRTMFEEVKRPDRFAAFLMLAN